MSKKTYVFFKDKNDIWHREAYSQPFVKDGKAYYSSACGQTIEVVETMNVEHEVDENAPSYAQFAPKPSNGEYCEKCDIVSDPWPDARERELEKKPLNSGHTVQ